MGPVTEAMTSYTRAARPGAARRLSFEVRLFRIGIYSQYWVMKASAMNGSMGQTWG
jgi:hypothetical protein